MVHVQQVENNRKKRGVDDARRPKRHDQEGPFNGGKRNNSALIISQDSNRSNRVQGTLTFRVVQQLEEADLRSRREMEVICSVPEKTVLSVALLTV